MLVCRVSCVNSGGWGTVGVVLGLWSHSRYTPGRWRLMRDRVLCKGRGSAVAGRGGDRQQGPLSSSTDSRGSVGAVGVDVCVGH